jgi:hypothetical protein
VAEEHDLDCTDGTDGTDWTDLSSLLSNLVSSDLSASLLSSDLVVSDLVVSDLWASLCIDSDLCVYSDSGSICVLDMGRLYIRSGSMSL